MAAERGGAIIVKTKSQVRRMRNVARDVDRALAELERHSNGDLWGRYVIRADEELDAAELLGFVEMAARENPGRELHVTVIAR